MILSHRHRFIFLKTSKTAGTSVELTLSRHCGPRDVLTPNPLEDEEIRRRIGARGWQNCLLPWWEHRLPDVLRLFRERQLQLRFYDHMPARELKPLLGEVTWNRCFKFCFVRNPWDRVISLYHWRHRQGPKPPLAEFLRTDAPLLRLRRSGWELYTIDGEVAVDEVYRYESLEEDLERARLRIGLLEPLSLPRAHSAARGDRRHYRELLDAGQRDRIGEVFQREIELFGYEF
jgi:hypothetical protein